MRYLIRLCGLLILTPALSGLALAAPFTPPVEVMELEEAERLADLALACVHREYPNKVSHVMLSDEDAAPPRELTPAFHGCFDWHSAVHGHWMLARLARAYADSPVETRAREVLERTLTPERLAGDLAYMTLEGRESWERPYGLAWLLQLALELREWDDPQAARWAKALEPLEEEAADRFILWLKKLSHPIREGEHEQTAFALGLVLDWARSVKHWGLMGLAESRARAYYLGDRGCPLDYEPSGQDFLSPCLAEADLVRRLFTPEKFARWLGNFLPEIPLDGRSDWLWRAAVTDAEDGKLVHLDGLNLSRAWMLEGIASGLPPSDPRRPAILASARSHAERGLASVTGEHYEGGHWLASYAVYLLTRRGIDEEGRERLATAAESSPGAPRSAEEAVNALLDDWHEASRVPDGERYFGSMAEDSIFMGTDAGERWTLEEYRAFAEPYFSKGQGWSFIPRDRRVTVSADGTLAWFDEALDSEHYGEARGSGVLRRDGLDWKIVHYNLAFTVPNDAAKKVVEVIREWQASAEAGEKEAR